MIKEEIHLFIIWEIAMIQYDRILNDIKDNFIVISEHSHIWEEDEFAKNLTRFYGKNLPKNSRKEKIIGTGPFKVLIVKDQHPVYKLRDTTKGKKLVNINIFDAKIRYRQIALWNGVFESTIHATNDLNEATEDIFLLTGCNIKFFNKKNFIVLNRINLLGTNGWESINSLLDVLNVLCNYVVLRNFENFLDQPLSEEHTDIDILTDDFDKFVRITGARNNTIEKNRVQYVIRINNKNIKFDIRSVGDNYLDQEWQKKILLGKVFQKENNIFIPDENNHFYSLLYHALINKTKIANNYLEIFTDYLLKNNIRINLKNSENLKDLLVWYLNENKYDAPIPKDPSVGYFKIDQLNSENYFSREIRKKKPFKRFIIVWVKKIGVYEMVKASYLKMKKSDCS